MSHDQAPTIAFSGTLDYRANVDAMVWFCADVLPKVRAVIPAAQCVVIGRRPALELKALATRGEITLTGEVEDTRPYLCGAAVYVVPMRIGGGARLKVLEAMALELPIVSTQMGAEGIDGVPAGVIQIADDADLFAQAVIAALQQQVVVPAARAFVQGSYDWRVIMPTWNSALQNTIHHAAQ
jgi:glycosyltransferase involved in cell wall biosynthesis